MDVVAAMVTANHLQLGKFDLNIQDKCGYAALDHAILSGIITNIPLVRELMKFKDSKKYDDCTKNMKEIEEIVGIDSSTIL
jgi:hypothetical protein